MGRTLAIGDIHGCNASFRKLLFEELKIQKDDLVICIGDYIDRGASSKGVVDTIISLREDGYNIRTLRGNHEQMMIDSANNPDAMRMWLDNGGYDTLESFRISSWNEMPAKYKDFFSATEYYIETDNNIFVHAGLDFTLPDIFSDTLAMLWIREFDTYQPKLGNKTMVHGHTPQPKEYILKQKGNCLNIDGGCVYGERKGYGNLFALDVDGNKLVCVRNAE